MVWQFAGWFAAGCEFFKGFLFLFFIELLQCFYAPCQEDYEHDGVQLYEVFRQEASEVCLVAVEHQQYDNHQ